MRSGKDGGGIVDGGSGAVLGGEESWRLGERVVREWWWGDDVGRVGGVGWGRG